MPVDMGETIDDTKTIASHIVGDIGGFHHLIFGTVTTMIHRYSSRRGPLKDFLATRLRGTRRYDRIAGFFSSSLLEVAGEALERMTPENGETCVRVVCNSCLNPLDVQTVAREA